MINIEEVFMISIRPVSDLRNKFTEIEKAILDRLPNAESFEAYHSIKERQYKYYRIYVKNFTIYYVVITKGKENKIMEERRILHNLQNREKNI